MANINHVDIVDPNLHEPKGTSTAQAGQVYVADGLGSGQWLVKEVKDAENGTAGQYLTSDGAGSATFEDNVPAPGATVQGMYDYNDLATATTPVALTVAGTPYKLTNDGLGAGTLLTYGLPGLTDIWDTTLNEFHWKNGGDVLVLGDTVDVRFDVEVTTTSTNTAVDLDVILGVGVVDEAVPVFSQINFKDAGTYRLVRLFSVYMGSTATLDNPTQVVMIADSTGVTVKVNGWYVRTVHTVQ